MLIFEDKKKPLLLIFPFNVMAHYLRCLQLARYLRPHFEVQFIQSDKYDSYVLAEGYSTFLCNTLDADLVLDCIRRFDFSWLNKKDLEHVYTSQVNVIQQLQPVVVLGDMCPTLKMAAESTRVQYIALMNGYMSKYFARVRQMPQSHPLFRFVKLLPESMAGYFIEMGEQLSYKGIHQPFNQLRSQYHLSQKQSYQDEMEGDLNLLCDLPELFPQKNLPAHYLFVPPLYYDPSENSSNIVSQLDKSKKTLFVSMGSTGNWNKVAFLNDPYFKKYNVVTAGDYNNVIDLPGVIKASFINIHDLFPHTDLVICHGGNGTIYQALLYGLPLLCKTVHFEQEWNVHMLESMGLGNSLDGLTTTEEYISLVEEWIQRKQHPEAMEIKKLVQNARENFGESIDAIIKNTIPARAEVLQDSRSLRLNRNADVDSLDFSRVNNELKTNI